MSQSSNKYDLEERTSVFGESIIDLCKLIRLNTYNNSIVNQLIRSATSVGANYMEANGASSRKDFKNKIFICKKEAQETKHWLRMLLRAEPEHSDGVRELSNECRQLILIFQKIISTLKADI